jgi:flagellar M-ring protein FliF
MPAGTLRKISVAVLVDQDVSWEKEAAGFKRVLLPPAPEKLKIIRDLVAGTIGFTQERGDQLVIETLPFETTLLTEPPSVTPPSSRAKPSTPPAFGLPFSLDRKQMMIAGGVAAALLSGVVLGIIVMRRRRKKQADTTTPSEIASGTPPGAPPALEEGAPSATLEKRFENQIAEREAMQQRLDDQALASLKLAPVITKKAEVFARHLREKIAKEPEISVQILRSWIREEEN